MSRFTVLGARGLIGSRLAAALTQDGHDVDTPPRDADLAGRPLGHVIYAIGVTTDFRTRVFDTVEAHVCRLNEILRDGRFDSLLYLSSTRVYQGSSGMVDETSPLVVNPRQPGELYNISKLAGESLALASGRPTRIVRISNVYDAGDRSQGFLPSIIRSALATGSVSLETAAASAKDYIALDDVISILPRIAIGGRERIYNVSSGENVLHQQLIERLAKLVPCRVRYAPGAAEVTFPRIANERVRAEFGLRTGSILDDLPALVEGYRACGELSPC